VPDTAREKKAMAYPVRKILRDSRTVAMVGLSARPEQDSYRVARYLIDHGYEVIPINPSADQILGRKSYASLRDLPQPPDVVDVFRRAEFAPEIVEDAIAAKAKAVWLQLGLVHRDAARRAREAGLLVVMDRCMKREHECMTGAAPAQAESAPPAATCQWRPQAPQK